MWNAPNKTRIVFDINKNIEHRLFTLSKPERLVIDIINASAPKNPIISSFNDSPLSGMRVAVRNKTDYRIVLSLKLKN